MPVTGLNPKPWFHMAVAWWLLMRHTLPSPQCLSSLLEATSKCCAGPVQPLYSPCTAPVQALLLLLCMAVLSRVLLHCCCCCRVGSSAASTARW